MPAVLNKGEMETAKRCSGTDAQMVKALRELASMTVAELKASNAALWKFKLVAYMSANKLEKRLTLQGNFDKSG